MRYLGIDPGMTGACSIVETIGGIPGLIAAIDVPTTGTGAKARVDATALGAWIAEYAPSTCFIERAQAFPGQGRSSAFLYGRCAGAIEAIVTLRRVPLVLIEAASWKRKLHLGRDKEQSRQRALQLFPQQHALLARRKDHNRAEAALLIIANLEGPR